MPVSSRVPECLRLVAEGVKERAKQEEAAEVCVVTALADDNPKLVQAIKTCHNNLGHPHTGQFVAIC